MTLVVALIAILMVTVMGGIAISLAQSNAASAERSVDTSVSDAVAEAGMNHARSILWSAVNPLDPNAVPQGEVKLFGGTGTYSGQLTGSVWTLTGVSHVTSGGRQITRTVSSQVAVEAGSDGPAVAVFSADSDCGGDSLNLSPANAVLIDGAIRSNGDLAIDSKTISIGHTSASSTTCSVRSPAALSAVSKSLGAASAGCDSAASAGAAASSSSEPPQAASANTATPAATTSNSTRDNLRRIGDDAVRVTAMKLRRGGTQQRFPPCQAATRAKALRAFAGNRPPPLR